MPIVCIGVNFRTAPVALRERLAFSPEAQRDLLLSRRLRDAGGPAGLSEFVLLSTCNRTELYAAAPDVSHHFHNVPGGLVEAFAEARGISPRDLSSHLYQHTSADAVRHLSRVAAGLDSMVLGETEILGQVSGAYERAKQEGAAGRVLEAVFHTAIRAGRRARTETGICRCPMSVSSEAVRVLHDTPWNPSDARVLIVGTGKMGRLAGEVMRAHGVQRLQVVGRTTAHAESLARLLSATPVPWHQLEAAIREADIVFCSTAAPHAVITQELVASALRGTEGRQKQFIDIAVPRDVEPAVRGLAGVTVFDLDDLQQRLARNLTARTHEVPAVEAIVDDELQHFEEWRHGAELRPLLAAMHQQSEWIRQREVARAMRKLKDVPPEVQAQFEALSRSLVTKLLHAPTQRLRTETDPATCDTYVRVTRDLFGLEADDAPRESVA